MSCLLQDSRQTHIYISLLFMLLPCFPCWHCLDHLSRFERHRGLIASWIVPLGACVDQDPNLTTITVFRNRSQGLAAQVTEVVSSRLHCSPIPVSTKHRSRRTDEQNRVGPKARMNRGFMPSARVGSGIDRSGAENGKSSLHHQHFRLVRQTVRLSLSESACRGSERSVVYAGTSLLVPSNAALSSLHASWSRGMDSCGSHMKTKCSIPATYAFVRRSNDSGLSTTLLLALLKEIVPGAFWRLSREFRGACIIVQLTTFIPNGTTETIRRLGLL
jgi:hypothetical protein